MRMWLPPRKGLVQLPPGHRKQHFLEGEAKADLNRRRSTMSLLAFVSDDMEVQAVLPQILVGNTHVLSVGDQQHLSAALRETTIFVLRKKSAWAGTDLLCKVFRLLGKALEGMFPTRHILFSMDANPSHLTDRVVRAAATAGVFLHFVPAGLTPWLQPLDAYCFAALKHAVRHQFEQRQLTSAIGAVSTLQMCEIICEADQATLTQKSWAHAFRGCGFGEQQRSLGKRLRRRLAWPDSSPVVPSSLPSLQQLQKVLTDRKRLPIGWLFHLCNEAAGAAQAATTEAGEPAASASPVTLAEPLARASLGAAPEHHLWHGRLRSSSQLDEPDNAEAASSSRPHSPAVPAPTAPCPPPAPTPAQLSTLPRARRLGPPRSLWQKEV